MKKPRFWLIVNVVMLGVVAFLQSMTVSSLEWPYLFGKNAEAMLDLWTLQHFSVGILVVYFFRQMAKRRLGKQWELNFVYVSLAGAYVFEALELWLEIGGAGEKIATWLHSLEHWSNRLVADPMALLFGMLVSRRYPRSRLIAFGFIVIWIVTQGLSPHCMYINDLFLTWFNLS